MWGWIKNLILKKYSEEARGRTRWVGHAISRPRPLGITETQALFLGSSFGHRAGPSPPAHPCNKNEFRKSPKLGEGALEGENH